MANTKGRTLGEQRTTGLLNGVRITTSVATLGHKKASNEFGPAVFKPGTNGHTSDRDRLGAHDEPLAPTQRGRRSR
jgi:hypothetical protein